MHSVGFESTFPAMNHSQWDQQLLSLLLIIQLNITIDIKISNDMRLTKR